MKKELFSLFKKRKRWIIAFLVVLFFYFSLLIYFNLDIIVGENLFLNINPSRSYIKGNNYENISLNYTLETKFNALCSLDCEYKIYDDSYERTVISSKLNLLPNINKEKSLDFILNSSGFGKKIYSFQLECVTVKNPFCRADKTINTNSFIMVEHKPSLTNIELILDQREKMLEDYILLNKSLSNLKSFNNLSNRLFFPYNEKYDDVFFDLVSNFNLVSNYLKENIKVISEPLYTPGESVLYDTSFGISDLNETISYELSNIMREYSFLEEKFSFILDSFHEIDSKQTDELKKFNFINDEYFYNLSDEMNIIKDRIFYLQNKYNNLSLNVSEFSDNLSVIYNKTNQFYENYYERVNLFYDFNNIFDNILLEIEFTSEEKSNILINNSNSFCNNYYSFYNDEVVYDNFSYNYLKYNSYDEYVQNFIIDDLNFKDNLSLIENESYLNSIISYYYNISSDYLDFLIIFEDNSYFLNELCDFNKYSEHIYNNLISFNQSFNKSISLGENKTYFKNKFEIQNQDTLELFYLFSNNLNKIKNYSNDYFNPSNKSDFDFILLHNKNITLNKLNISNLSIFHFFESKLLSYKNNYNEIYSNKELYNLEYYYFLKENILDLMFKNNSFDFFEYQIINHSDLFYFSIFDKWIINDAFKNELHAIDVSWFEFDEMYDVLNYFSKYLSNGKMVNLETDLEIDNLFSNSDYLNKLTSFQKYCCYNSDCKLCLNQDVLMSDYFDKNFTYYHFLNDEKEILNSNRSIVLFLHGHSMIEGNPPEFSLRAFSNYQKELKKENVIDGGVVTLFEKYSGDDILFDFDFDISFRSTYYFDYHSGEEFDFLIPKKSDGIDVYSIRLKEIIDGVISKTDSSNISIVAHSMGGLVSRRYISLFDNHNIDNLFMIGTPNHGIIDQIKTRCVIFGSRKSCEDMYENSLFIKKLNSYDYSIDVNYFNVVGSGCNFFGRDGDGIVTKESVKLSFADNYIINGSCSPRNIMHISMLDPFHHPEVFDLMKENVLK